MVLTVATQDLLEGDKIVGAMGETAFPFGVTVRFVVPSSESHDLYSISTVEFESFHAFDGKAWTVQRRPQD